MIAIGFAEANQILRRPESLTAEQCSSLEVFQDGKWVISRWQFTDEELKELKANGGKVYLMVLGESMYPVILQTKTPFMPRDECSQNTDANA